MPAVREATAQANANARATASPPAHSKTVLTASRISPRGHAMLRMENFRMTSGDQLVRGSYHVDPKWERDSELPDSNRQLETIRNGRSPFKINRLTFSNRPKKTNSIFAAPGEFTRPRLCRR